MRVLSILVDGSRNRILLLLIMAILNGLTGCSYYTYQRDTSPTMEKLRSIHTSTNYLIVHSGGEAWNLSRVKLDMEREQLSGVLLSLPDEHRKYLDTKPTPGSSNHYFKKSKRGRVATPHVVNEVHLYVRDSDYATNQEARILIADIDKMEVYDPDTGTTAASKIFTGASIAVVVVSLFSAFVYSGVVVD